MAPEEHSADKVLGKPTNLLNATTVQLVIVKFWLLGWLTFYSGQHLVETLPDEPMLSMFAPKKPEVAAGVRFIGIERRPSGVPHLLVTGHLLDRPRRGEPS
jgi:hypothetical protein